jgi:hypothetical protein
VLRVVLLQQPPRAEQQAALLAALRGLRPASQGESASLEVEPPPTSRKSGLQFPLRWVAAILLCAIVGVGLRFGWEALAPLIPQFAWPRPAATASNAPELAALAPPMAAWLDEHGDGAGARWSDLAEREPAAVVEQFFRRTSQEGWEGVRLPAAQEPSARHPDVQFLRRFPARPVWSPDHGTSVAAGLADLHAAFAAIPDAKAATSAEQSLQGIIELADYRNWWRTTPAQVPPDAWDVDPGKPLSAVARGYCPTPAKQDAWQIAAATDLVEDLQRWGVRSLNRDDARARPWLVCAVALRLLSQESLPKPVTQEAAKCRADYFVSFLPPQATKAEAAGDMREEELLAALHRRSKRTFADPADNLDTAIQRIRQCCSYRAFVDETKAIAGRYPDRPSTVAGVERLVHRFRGDE